MFSSQLQSGSSGLTTAGKVAIALLVIWSVVVIPFTLYLHKRRAPVRGSRMRVDRNGLPVSYHSSGYTAARLVLPLISLLLKLLALGLDTWAVADSVRFGLFRERIVVSHDEYGISYASMCKHLSGGTLTKCNTVRASGILTLICGIVSCVSSLLYLCVALGARRSLEAFGARVLRLWRWGYRAHLSTSSAYIYWICGAYLIFAFDNKGSNVSLGASWWIFLAAMIFDQIILSMAVQAVRGTPADLGAPLVYAGVQQPAVAYQPQQIPYAVPVQQAPQAYFPPQQQQPLPPYQPLPSYQPQPGYPAQQQQPYYPQQQPPAYAQGYAQPVYGQPTYAAPHPSFAPPQAANVFPQQPAYNPHATH